MNTYPLWLWLGPYVLLMLLMVVAMMEFTVSLLAKRPAQKRQHPLDADALRERLAQVAAESDADTVLVGQACDVELIWKTATELEAPRLRGYRARQARLRLLLDAERREVRMGETSRSAGYLVGLVGWLPRLAAYAGYSANPPAASRLTDDLRRIVLAAGWSYRPVILPWFATYRGAGLLRRLTPASLRRARSTALWGAVYVLAYWLGMGWLCVFGGPALWTPRALALLGLISAVWWGVWGLLAWAVCGFPRFWRRAARSD